MTNFEWSEQKNLQNYHKHHVWFEEAHTIWGNPHSVEFFDPCHSKHEDRFIRNGHTSRRLLLVIFCEKLDRALIRIISARAVTLKERGQYEEGI